MRILDEAIDASSLKANRANRRRHGRDIRRRRRVMPGAESEWKCGASEAALRKDIAASMKHAPFIVSAM